MALKIVSLCTRFLTGNLGLPFFFNLCVYVGDVWGGVTCVQMLLNGRAKQAGLCSEATRPLPTFAVLFALLVPDDSPSPSNFIYQLTCSLLFSMDPVLLVSLREKPTLQSINILKS